MDFRELLPQDPWLGPPLPKFLGILWPWVRGRETSLVPSQEPRTTYDNLEEIELLDIDPDLLMPRKIRIKRKATVAR